MSTRPAPTVPMQPQREQAEGAPKRIVWLEDGPYVLSEPRESTSCCVSWVKTGGGWAATVEQRPSAMVSRIERPATVAEVNAWREA